MKKKIIKKWYKAKIVLINYFHTNILFFTFIMTSLLNTCLLRFLTVKNYLSIEPVLGDLAVLLILGAFGYLFKPKNQFKYFITCTFFVILLCIINSMYYTNYVSFASFSLLATSLQVIDVGDAIVENVMELKDFSYLWQFVVMILVNYHLKRKDYFSIVGKVENGKLRCLNTLVASLIVGGVFISTLTSTAIGRLGKQWNREYIVMKYGALIYQVNDLLASVKPQISPLFGYDEASKTFREYYEQNKLDNTVNQYTDIYKGKNVIFIHAESIQNWLLNTTFNGKEVTPTLNKLSKEGLYFSNFYAQESVGTSSDSEFTLSTSLMPATSGTVFVSYWDREYPTIQKLVKDKGYYTFSMHGNKGSFWNRNVVHKEFGYDDFYYYTKDFEIDETIGLGLSDKSFFKQVVPKIEEIAKTHENFFGTLIMLTNHTPFSDIENYSDFEVDYKYKAVNPQTGEIEEVSAPFLEGTKLGNYVKSVHYADEAIGQFIQDMDDAGLLDDTVIVIYGDHDAKLKRSEYIRYYNYDPYTDTVLNENDLDYQDFDTYDYELNRKVPFIIWTKDHQLKTEVKEVMGMYNVLPTIGNMFGFQSEYALGKDIFSVKENFVPFPDGSWVTNKMYYNSQKEEAVLLDPNAVVSVEYIEKYTEKASEMITISNDIIVYDLIRKLRESEKLVNGEKNYGE